MQIRNPDAHAPGFRIAKKLSYYNGSKEKAILSNSQVQADSL